MVSKAKVRYLRTAPRKVRQVINLIRGEDVIRALAILKNVNRAAALPVEKVLTSAISNAKQSNLKEAELYIAKITADEGPMFKRFRAQAMGRATTYRHRTSHVYVELERKG
ncbi:MAG: 50S ribosomal protein L22 [Candidatus Omnitrophica bacterium]|nr:50S ribosomal protein L22 [Candidatus Omnitrophota bacterium]